jgi:hypothetical protein
MEQRRSSTELFKRNDDALLFDMDAVKDSCSQNTPLARSCQAGTIYVALSSQGAVFF